MKPSSWDPAHIAHGSNRAHAALEALPQPARAWSKLRVAKTYAPHQNGAKRFALRFGDPLVCVRHRLDAAGTTRHTTVELVVESTPVVSRAKQLVAVRIAPTDRATRQNLMARGAKWDSKQRHWVLPRAVAKDLRLLRNVVPLQG